jgi:hypothetical protein
MKRTALFVFVVVACLQGLLRAQQGGLNTSVLPARSNLQVPPGTTVADEYLKTDLIAQKQVEGSIASSTRKPDRLFAVFNDYRGVNASDFLLGETPVSGSLINTLIARLFHRPTAKDRARLQSVRAAGSPEAWAGGSISNDGGGTWSGLFLPGSPADNSPASLASPLKKYNFQAATDPWIASGPCGYFYVGLVAFTRLQDSAVAVLVYQDQNNLDGVHTIKYIRTSIVAYVRNASQGPFVDLPYLTVDPRRPAGADACAQNVYVTWMTFNGKDQSTKPGFARSLDYGATWSKSTVSAQAKTNQRAVLAVDPQEGTPATTGGGTLYLGFRSFANDNPIDSAMWVTRSIDYGNFFDKPVMVNGTQLQAFDQKTVTSGSGADFLAFRTNAYVSMAVVPQFQSSGAPAPSALYAVWSERVCVFGGGCPGSVPFGRPYINGDPRIVMMTASASDWRTWKDPIDGTVGQRQAIDFDFRDVVSPPAPGLGMLPEVRPSGAQFQPHLVSGGNQLGMVYYESRGPLTVAGATPAYVGGLHRQVDARFAVLNPASGALAGTSQISRYPISVDATLGDGEQRDDIADVAIGAHSKAINDKPNSGGGTAAFYGDYTGGTPIVSHVIDPVSRQWRWAFKAGDAPYPGARVVFADSRNVIPPLDAAGNPLPDAAQIAAFPTFQPWINPDGTPNAGCVNPGSRNHDMMHTLVNSSVLLNVPTTFKTLGTIQRSFPVSIVNSQGTSRWYRLDLAPADSVQASFVQGDSPIALTTIATQLWANVLPYSSTTRPVYVASSIPTGSVRVDLYEVTSGTDQTGTKVGSVTLNMDPSNTSTALTSETHNSVVSPLVTAPLVTAPLVTANGYTSSTANPLVTAPLVTAASPTDAVMTQDFSWSVNGGTDIVNSAMTLQVAMKNVDLNKLSTSYKFELRISRRATHTGVGLCGTGTSLGDEQIISSIPLDPANPAVSDPTQSPLVTAPLVTAPLVTAPLVTAPLVTAATFSMAPPDTHTGSYHDGTTHDVIDNRVYITLRAYGLATKNNLPDLPTPTLTVQALSKNIVPDGLGGYKFDGNPKVFASAHPATGNTATSPVIVVADSGRWVAVDKGGQR